MKQFNPLPGSRARPWRRDRKRLACLHLRRPERMTFFNFADRSQTGNSYIHTSSKATQIHLSFRRNGMRTRSRRDFLKLTSAVGGTSLICSAALGQESDRRTCKLSVIGKGLTVYIGGQAFPAGKDGKAASYQILVEYFTEDDKMVCKLPWDPHIHVKCPRDQKTADKPAKFHSHNFEVKSKEQGVSVMCDPMYEADGKILEPRKTNYCYFSCGGHSVCVPENHCVLCGGIQRCC